MDYLPIFMNIRQQHCVIVGGGAVAARKADLFIKAGAMVTVIAPQLKQEMQFHLSHGKIIWLMETFSEEVMASLSKPELMISATDQQDVNLAVHAYGKAKGIPVNVADQTEYCDFILPAIVDRDPMIVAVSTGGRSPVLARLIKAKLEQFLPHGFAKLTDLVGRYRGKVKQAVKTESGRKNFWEKVLSSLFIDKAVHGKDAEAESMLQDAIQVAETTGEVKTKGEVYLIGAGPGDPDLMTFKGLRLLQQADVVLYDRLVAPEILDMARREAERIYVGKKDKWHKVAQPNISQLMVELAKQGKRVARLKGGAPYIFGRGAEEAEVLVENEVAFEVVPGITAAAACSVYAGFPLTHRDYAQSVSLVTGHQQAGAEAIDYARLAQSGDTMVFYMGNKNAANIQSGLLAHGVRGDMPVAIVQNGTRHNQKNTFTQLNHMHQTILEETISPPALLIIGEVVAVRERLTKSAQGDDASNANCEIEPEPASQCA